MSGAHGAVRLRPRRLLRFSSSAAGINRKDAEDPIETHYPVAIGTHVRVR